MSEEQQIAVAMAIRDLVNATVSLMNMPADLVRAEYDDIDAVHKRLTVLLIRRKEAT